MKLRDLHKGDFFTKTPNENPKPSQVWIRGDYDRAQHKFECQRFDDANEFCYLPGDKEVCIGFTF